MNTIKRLFRSTISYKIILIFLIIVFCILLFPMLYTAKWNIPAADDFRNAKYVHDVVMNGGNFFDIIRAAFDYTKYYYFNWQGTSSAIFLEALQPIAFDEKYYFLVPYIMLIPLISGVCVFVRRFYSLFSVTVRDSMIIALVSLIGCTQFLHSPVEGFYWFSGAILYTFFFSISLILYALVIKMITTTEENKNTKLIIITCLLCFITAFSNFVTALTSAILLVSLLFFLYFVNKNKNWKLLILPAVFFAAGFYLNITAPGNAVRQSQNAKSNLVWAVTSSLKYSFVQLKNWNTIPVIVLYLLLCPLLWKIAAESKSSFKFPWLITLYSYCLFSSMNAPTFYTISRSGSGRSQNLSFFWMILLIPVNFFYWFGFLQRKKIKFLSNKNHPKMNLCYFLLILAVFIYGAVNLPINKPMVSLSAVKSYINGEMGLYKHVFNQRLVILKNPEVTDPILRPFPYPRPYLFFFDDITYYPDYWLNTSMSDYYHKNSVRLAYPEELSLGE